MKSLSIKLKSNSIFTFLLLLIFYSTFYLTNFLNNWPFLQLGDAWFNRLFDDTYQVLKTAECYSRIGRLIYEQNTCGNFVYGSFLLYLLALFKIFSSASVIVGVIFMVLNILIFTFLTFLIQIRVGWKSGLVSVLISISPPFHYLLERGNFDTLILGLLFLSSLCFNFKKYKTVLILLSLATLFKFYTLPVLFIFTFLISIKRIRYYAFYVFTTVFVTIYTLRDAIQVREFISNGTGGYGGTFGVKSLLLYMRHYSSFFDNNFWAYIYYLVFILLFIGILYKYKNSIYNEELTLKASWGICYIFGTQIIFIFFTFVNNDYRLSLLGIYLMASILNPINKTSIHFYTIVLGMFSMWLSYPSWVLQVLGDVSLLVVISLITYQLFSHRKVATQSISDRRRS